MTTDDAGVAPLQRPVMQHTPGPWHVSGSGPTVYALHGQPQRNRFSATMQGGRRDDAPLLELVANATLCAAAPDLLNALCSLLRHAERMQEVMDEECASRFRDDGPMSMARDALRLAVGAA
jgi:hypothetical protein